MNTCNYFKVILFAGPSCYGVFCYFDEINDDEINFRLPTGLVPATYLY